MNKDIRRKVLPPIGVGLLVILVTIAGYFLTGKPEQWESLDYFSLGFVLFSEVLLFFAGLPASLLHNARGKVLVRSGINGILFLHWLISCLLGFLARPLFTVERTNLFLLCNLVLLALTFISLIVFSLVAKRSQHLEEQAYPTNWVQDCLKLITSMQEQNPFPALERPLQQLAEATRYADPTNDCSQDARIHGELVLLQQTLQMAPEDVDVLTLQEKMIALLGLFKERALESSQQKRGKF